PLGVLGLVLAILGPLAPIGVVVSLVAVRREPRGAAIAGVIVGIVMTLITLVCGGFAGWGLWIGLKIQPQQEEIVSDYLAIQNSIDAYKQNNNDSPPPDLATLGLDPALTTSPFGDTYDYRVESGGEGWSIGFVGEDGVSGTSDDTRLSGRRESLEQDPFGWQDLTQRLMRPHMPGS
ncbi:MAG: DUF4190 domain-containing protein, partial [Planctomycetota bacterium]